MNMNWYNFLKKTRAKVALHVNIPHEESGKQIYNIYLFVIYSATGFQNPFAHPIWCSDLGIRLTEPECYG